MGRAEPEAWKKRQIEDAKAAGYEKREWSVSVLVLHDDYYDKGRALAAARNAYWAFRGRFDSRRVRL